MKYLIPCLISMFFVVGCASTPSYEENFSASQQVKGNVAKIPASMEITWEAALEVLSKQGFIVQQTDPKSRIILAGQEKQDMKDKDYSHTVTANLTFVPLSDQSTQVMVAANETTEFHKKEYRWWKLLWMIPLFPVGTDYTTVVVNRDTVRSPKFYQGFFDALELSCDEKKKLKQQIPGS